MTSVAIVAHFAYGAMTGGEHGHIGGVERQTTLMARWLAARDHDVSLITWDEGQPANTVIDGVQIIKLCREEAGFRGARFIHPRWTSLNRALAAANAEIYYQNCAEYVTGQVAWWCRRQKRAFVYSVASDLDCDPALPRMRKWRERVLYRYGLRHADRIIVQTRKQQDMLRAGFALDAGILPMACPAPPKPCFPKAPGDGQMFRVLWVGRITPSKRLEVLLDAAEALPDIHFDVAGPYARDPDYSAPVLRRAQAQPNVKVHGPVARVGMEELYTTATVLCCTSAYEGFPNTFLEAWSHGLPIISTVDPDGLLGTYELGIPVGGSDEIISGLKALAGSPRRLALLSNNARGYYERYHTVDAAMARFEGVFDDLLRSGYAAHRRLAGG